VAAHDLMVDTPARLQILRVAQVAEGAMSHVVKQPSYPQQGLCQGLRRAADVVSLQSRIEMPGKTPCHVHGPQGMLKPAVFGRRVDPEGTLQLVDVSEPLHPGMADEFLLGHIIA
jgi:hypothetical protein